MILSSNIQEIYSFSSKLVCSVSFKVISVKFYTCEIDDGFFSQGSSPVRIGNISVTNRLPCNSKEVSSKPAFASMDEVNQFLATLPKKNSQAVGVSSSTTPTKAIGNNYGDQMWPSRDTRSSGPVSTAPLSPSSKIPVC